MQNEDADRRCHCSPVHILVWPFPRIPFGHNPPVLPRTFVQRMSLRTSDRCHWCGNPFPKAFPWGGAPRSELKSNNCQWQLLHNVKVARASPASARRMRASCRTLIYKMQNAKCKMRMRKEIVIAAQSADWCGNPSVFQNAIGNACHCEPVRRLVWQSVTPAFPWGKVPAAAGG